MSIFQNLKKLLEHIFDFLWNFLNIFPIVKENKFAVLTTPPQKRETRNGFIFFITQKNIKT